MDYQHFHYVSEEYTLKIILYIVDRAVPIGQTKGV